MKKQTTDQIIVPALYETNLLRNLLVRYEKRGGLKVSDIRSLNYAAKRINRRALKRGAPEDELNYQQ